MGEPRPEWLIVMGFHLVNASRKSLQTHNENVWGHGITLPDASGGVEGLDFPTIDKDLDRASGDAGYNEF